MTVRTLALKALGAAAAAVLTAHATAAQTGTPYANGGPRALSAAPSATYGAPPSSTYGAPSAAQRPRAGRLAAFSPEEIVSAGHQTFGEATSELARGWEELFARYGYPNGYIVGQEASGAFVGGLRYGEGELRTRDQGSFKIYWQGPSLGYDFGADGARTMILLYGLDSVQDAYRRYGGVSAAAYVVGGMGVTTLTSGEALAIPLRTGVGARLGVNAGYLKFRTRPTWNPF